MQKINRYIKNDVIKKLQPNKVVVLYGPRQVGKTTLVKDILKNIKGKYLFLNGENRSAQKWLSSQEIDVFKQYIGDNKLLVIDEAQKIKNIGLNLKLIVDHFEGIKVLATGSSSFELANQVGEPLVGRKWQFTLYPISQIELKDYESRDETDNKLESKLIYGSYPEAVKENVFHQKQDILNEIVDSYLYRDLLEFNEIKKSQKIIDILKNLAFQIGQEVSLQELGNAVSLNLRTVEKYLDLLEKTFVIKRVYGFSRNLRKEISKMSRFYFFDNGVRNAIIQNFNTLDLRNDIGQLWENYLFMERLKRNSYKNIRSNIYFWRTYDQKEIDLVEEREGKLFGYEFKYSENKKVKPPRDWLETYKEAEFEVINKSNYLDFIV
ncbi:ATP-binding protein [Candidatus Parcubacteria bacterium]|nr:ATP-binding protein [Candidatus Parcubacteria bacterium]